MNCSTCQTENPEGVKFCGECGADGWVEKAERKLAEMA
jgi:hypothetical protein